MYKDVCPSSKKKKLAEMQLEEIPKSSSSCDCEKVKRIEIILLRGKNATMKRFFFGEGF